MRPGWLLVTALLAACAEPRLDVDFAIPKGYRDQVASVVLRVLSPPDAAPFSCDELALGHVAPEALAAARVLELVASPGRSVKLAGVPRLGPKLLHASGLDADELEVVAGCAELGDVDGDVALVIEGEPTKVVAVREQPLGEPLPAELTVTVTDVFGEPLEAAAVAWTVTGPAGETTTAATTTDDRGRAIATPAQPTLAGPQVLDLHVRFAAAAAPPISGFRALAERFRVELPGDLPAVVTPDGQLVVGAIGPGGEPGFASLAPVDALAPRAVVLAWYDATTDALISATSAPLAARALGLVRRTQRDVVMTINGTGWHEIEPDGDVVDRPDIVLADPALASRIVPLGGCGAGQANQQILVELDAGLIGLTADGAPVSLGDLDPAPASRLVGSGCAAVSDGEIVRVVALGGTGNRSALATLLDGGRTGALTAPARGIGFAPALGDAAPALLATRLEVDGTRIGRYRLAVKGASALDTELLVEDDIASFSLSTTGGDVDGDGLIDVGALLYFGGTSRETETRVHLALGTPHAGGRLGGLSLDRTTAEPRLELLDLDGDGLDELITATATEIVVYTLLD